MSRDYSRLPSVDVDIYAKLDRVVKEYPNGYTMARYLVWDKEVLSYIDSSKTREFIMIKGNNLPKLSGILYRFRGRWSVDAKGRLWFNSRYSEMQDSSTKKAAIRTLASDNFPSVNRKLADKLVDHFENEIWNVISSDQWDRLCEVKEVTKEMAEQIHLSYLRTKSITILTRFLSQYGITSRVIEKIHDVYQEEAIQKISTDPYRMIDEVKGVGFETCDRIAKGMYERGEKIDVLQSQRRIQACIMASLKQECSATGGMYVEGNHLYRISMERLNKGLNLMEHPQGLVTMDLWQLAFSDLKEKGLVVDRRFNTGCNGQIHLIYIADYDWAERNVACRFLAMNRIVTGISQNEAEQAVKQYSASQKFPLSKNQQEACIRSLLTGVSIITGGPGTGKTTILKCLISSFQKLTGEPVTCMAPTGKAARRMTESTNYPASTIHSRLGLIAVEGVRFETHRIERGLVVVDEVSMVDTLLMNKLVEALGDQCILVLVGDVDQLPSVGEGAVLAQLISSGCIPTYHLTETFRQGEGSLIISNAAKVNCGRSDFEYNEDFQFIPAEDEQDAVRKIAELYKKEVDLHGIDNVALLSPLRANKDDAHPCSSDGLNPVLQDIFNPAIDEEHTMKCNGREFRINDRVMKWSNGEKSSNGDIGVVRQFVVDKGVPALLIQWDNGNEEIIRKQDFDMLTLAYSMSIHKSQGSEYFCVIIPVLSAQRCRLFHKALLYTALTRSKAKVFLVGDQKAIVEMCSNRDMNQRASLLSARLRYNSQKK